MQNKKAFSFVEIIVVISILALLAVVWLSMQWASKQKTQNTKAIWDIQTLNNSFESYLTENKTLPNPKGNINYFGSGSEYIHVNSWSEDDTSISFWKHWFVTENILPKKYLNYLPLDPRTSQYYAYWKTTDSQFFEIAWVLKIEWTNTSSVSGNYPWENWPYNLIKEYNWPDFVSNNSKTSFPYNPDEKILIAKINNFTGNITISWPGYNITQATPNQILNHTLVQWDTITVSTWWQATLYYSDWSQSTLWDTTWPTELNLAKMEFKQEDNLVTRIQLALESWTIWTKATSLNTDSEFTVETQDVSASVRWTIFWIQKNIPKSSVTVEKWKILITEKSSGNIIPKISWQSYLTPLSNPFPTQSPTTTNPPPQQTLLEKEEAKQQQEFEKIANKTKSCETEVYDDTSCVTNTLWDPWILKRFEKNITDLTPLWLTGSTFALEFTTNDISKTQDLMYYIKENNNKILNSKGWKIKLWWSWGAISYSNNLLNWTHDLILQIEQETWKLDWLTMNSSDSSSWEPRVLFAENIQLNNIKDVKIYSQ